MNTHDACLVFDFLGRVPVPLRRAFATALDRLNRKRQEGTPRFRWGSLAGSEWYRPFDRLLSAERPDEVPAMLASSLQNDILSLRLQSLYRNGEGASYIEDHPLVEKAGLADPKRRYELFGLVPFVWLIDKARLKGSSPPKAWRDLLHPRWRNEIVFGGWRPHEGAPYREYNTFLLRCLHHEFGDEGLRAFARNVRLLQHNVRTAALAGSHSTEAGAIAILPWMQALLNPRRGRTQVVWPSDGALTLPMVYMVKPEERERLAPFMDFLTGPKWASVLIRNAYPPTGRWLGQAGLPPGASFKWPGWAHFLERDPEEADRKAAEIFFAAVAWSQEEILSCA